MCVDHVQLASSPKPKVLYRSAVIESPNHATCLPRIATGYSFQFKVTDQRVCTARLPGRSTRLHVRSQKSRFG